MSNLSDTFDRWIRGSFMEINTELENLYFAQDDRADVSRCGANLKSQLRDEGHLHVVALLAEGDTGDGFETAFGVLGNVGMYLAALRRHELTNPAREERSPFPKASSLAMHVGAALGMAPRFSTLTSRISTSRTRACARVSRRCPTRSCSSTRTRAASCCCSSRPMRWRK